MVDIFSLLNELVSKWEDKEDVIDFLGEQMGEQGIEPRIEKEPSPILFARQGENGPSFCLYCHIDTPPPYALSQPVFKVENNKAYGLGICDKASVVAMFDVFLEMKGKIEKGSLDLVIASDSEEKGEGLRKLLETGYEPRWVIVGEPTNLSVITHHPGLLLLDIYCYGLSAPAAFPSAGINSIEQMTEFLTELKARLPFILLGIRGGESILRVPESCRSTLAVPLPTEKDSTWALRILDGVLKNPKWIDVSYHILRVENPLKEELFSPLAQIARDKVREVLGVERELAPPGWSEASRFQERGAEVIVFGAGEPKVAHSGEEYIVLEDVVNETKVLQGIISSFLSS